MGFMIYESYSALPGWPLELPKISMLKEKMTEERNSIVNQISQRSYPIVCMMIPTVLKVESLLWKMIQKTYLILIRERRHP